MNNKTPSHSIDRLLGPVGWIVALTLAAILNLRIWIETTMLFVTISAVVVALIILLMIYRRKEKQTGEIIPPLKNIQVPHAAFEKLLAQVTDLRIAFRAVAYIGSVLLIVFSFFGYTKVKDITKEAVSEDIDRKLTGFQKRLDNSQKQMDTFQPQLSRFKDRLTKDLQTSEGLVMTVLSQKYLETDMSVPLIDADKIIPITTERKISGRIVLGKPVAITQDSTEYAWCKIIFDRPESVINLNPA
jgi:heme/copper-type cytochrome/quinol oxidase subunit 2